MALLNSWSGPSTTLAISRELSLAPAVRAAQALGWPTDIPETEKVPMNPPFTWDYTGHVQYPGGPGPVAGLLAQAVVQFEEDQVIEIVLQNARALNGAAGFHPWHSHGHSFWVMGSGDGIFDPETDPASYNLEKPVLRDTVNVWPLQWVALRFVANNPGVWFFHCHITAYLMMGVGLNMVVQPDVLEDPSDSVRYCQEMGLEPGDDGGSDDGETTRPWRLDQVRIVGYCLVLGLDDSLVTHPSNILLIYVVQL
jgi:hypothetical protein